jgi:CubicO group peptidase (beta-lactamase class C family)
VKPFLDDLLRSGAATAAATAVGTAEHILAEETAGEVTPASRFDYASLTKPFVATLALVLDAAGVLPLSTRVAAIWPAADPRLGRKPLSDLLRHRSGLAAWRPLYHLCRPREEVLDLILGGSLLGTRAGTYSDLDYILYGMTAERVTGTALGELVRSRVLIPLGLASVEPAPGDQPDAVESRMDSAQEVLLAARQGLTIVPPPLAPRGLPQDGNARFLIDLAGGPGRMAGRLSGHAGLFGTARDLWALGAEWLAPGRLLQPEAVTAALGGGGRFALGWWRRTLRGSAGRALSRSSFGHTGFAGGSLWIDPHAGPAEDTGRIYVLLAARADPLSNMNRWRRRFHGLASRRIFLEAR